MKKHVKEFADKQNELWSWTDGGSPAANFVRAIIDTRASARFKSSNRVAALEYRGEISGFGHDPYPDIVGITDSYCFRASGPTGARKIYTTH